MTEMFLAVAESLSRGDRAAAKSIKRINLGFLPHLNYIQATCPKMAN